KPEAEEGTGHGWHGDGPADHPEDADAAQRAGTGIVPGCLLAGGIAPDTVLFVVVVGHGRGSPRKPAKRRTMSASRRDRAERATRSSSSTPAKNLPTVSCREARLALSTPPHTAISTPWPFLTRTPSSIPNTRSIPSASVNSSTDGTSAATKSTWFGKMP